MLIISRKRDQKIVIADDIEITILEVGRNRVRFGIKAPKHIPIQTRLKTSVDTPPLDGNEPPALRDVTAKAEPLEDFPAAVGLQKRR